MRLSRSSSVVTNVEEQTSESGGAELLSPAHRSERAKHFAAEGFLVARVVPVFEHDDQDDDARPSLHGLLRRGGLREALEGAIEISLALRGALPPSVEIDAAPMKMARDQLFRVRTLEAAGLCLVFPELRRMARDGMLHGDDSEALLMWKELSEEANVVLLLDEGDRDVTMLAPTSLADALELTDAPRARWVEDVRAHADSVDGLLIDHGDDDAFGDVEAELYGDASDDEEDDDEDTMQFEAEEREALRGLDEALASEAHAPAQHQVWHEQGKARIMASDPLDGIEDIAADKLPIQASLFEDVDATVHAAVKAFTVEPAPALPDDVVQRYCDELDEAQGPKPVATIEQLFKTRYTPLLEALSRGLCDQVAGAVVEDWRAAFDKSYCDAFTAIRATLKRPTMVLDAPDVATRIARLNGARAVQLLLVDSMRYDLGERVLEELKSRISHRAVCVEQTLMWSAMPTVTPTQMTLLSRGARGLREEAPKSEREAIIQRDGSVDALRRVRIGHRDLVKLDLVEARLRDAGGPFEERMAHIAGEVATVIARFSESLAPKTLLYVFGDHGFRLPVRAAGTTGPASQGGASPEEVLVGAQAWLVGDVH